MKISPESRNRYRYFLAIGTRWLDNDVYRIEKESKEWIDRVDAAQRDRLNTAIDAGKKALRSGAPDEIQKALEELTQAFSAAGAAVYQAQQGTKSEGAPPPGGEGAAPSGDKKKDDVVEADYEIVDESKNRE